MGMPPYRRPLNGTPPSPPHPVTPVPLFRHPDRLPDEYRHSAVSIGNFDGVHLGHAKIVERLLAVARQVGGSAVAFTFDPHPVQILRPEKAPAPLCGTERNAQLLCELGVDAVLAYPTDRELLQLEAREFFDRILRDRLNVRAMVEGPNFFFGHGRSGDIHVLRQFCDEAGVLLEVAEPIEIDGEIVSSSRIRTLLADGRVEEVRRLMSRPYRIRGIVVPGQQRGAALGYPTANIGRIDTLLPGEGIYAGVARVNDSQWPAAVSIGPNPTFDEQTLKVEAFLIGYRGSLYDHPIELDFLARLRDIKRFDSADELVTQMDRDVTATREIVGKSEIRNLQ